ncbi:MAG TPA: restriction endonuclease subunit S [Blastocatellia bacterium]|nr:restriction endonuclease subunit S [Blastocatellia bacterium]
MTTKKEKLPPGWELRRIDEIGEVHSGSTPPTWNPEFWDGGITWITPNDLSRIETPYLSFSARTLSAEGLRQSSKRLLPPYSIVISSRAPIGYVAIPTVEFCTNQGCKSLDLDDDYQADFVYYNLNFHLKALKSLGEGTTFTEISKAALCTIRLPFPVNRVEQERISTILLCLDRTMELTRGLIAKRKRLLAGVMQSLLTRGIDPNGKVRSETAHRFKDSPVGRIPMEWETVTLSELVPGADYGISAPLGEEGAVPVLRMNNLKDGEVELADLKYSSGPEAARLLLRPLDVLFNRTNSIEHVGRTGIWRGQLARASFASYLVRLVLDRDRLLPEYLNFWLNLGTTRMLIKNFATIGVHQANINPTNLRKTTIALPQSLGEQQAIVDFLNTHKAMIRLEERKLEKFRQIKRGLMQDLFTGRVRIETPMPPVDVAL